MSTELNVIRSPNGIKNDAWLIVNGVAVAFIRFERCRNDKSTAIVRMVETREGFKRKGYASEILTKVESQCSIALVSEGGYTRDGLNSLGAKIPMLNNRTLPSQPDYKPWNCVQNWDDMVYTGKTKPRETPRSTR